MSCMTVAFFRRLPVEVAFFKRLIAELSNAQKTPSVRLSSGESKLSRRCEASYSLY